MAKISSVFGNVATEKLQTIIDNSLSMFDLPQWKKWFSWGIPKTSLNYTTIIGRSRIEAAASVVARGSSAPIRSRAGLEKIIGQVAQLKEKFQMDEETYRDYRQMKESSIMDDTAKFNLALEMIFGDVKLVANSVNKRIDILTEQALSTGKISLSTTNNPDGMVTNADIDLLMPAGNRKNPVTVWSSITTADIIADLEAIRALAKAKGIVHEKMLMDETTWGYVRNNTLIKTFLTGRKDLKISITLDALNTYLRESRLPVIELVNGVYGVEKDGVISTVTPWLAAQVTFLPAGQAGIIHNSIPIEKFEKVAGVTYADFERALISKWQDNDPWGEYTAVEANLFPGWENIEQCYILDTDTAA